MLKLGLIGFGHLGKIHFKCLKETPFEVIGIFDPQYVGKENHESVSFYENCETLIEHSDAIIVASSTKSHYEICKMALQKDVHIFVEKPMTSSLFQARKLVTMAEEKPHLKTMVGYVERFNPTYVFLKEHILNPRFIEVHRLSTFSNRGLDTSVVFDLMIHDLDLILNMKREKIIDIKASGVKLITDSLDICNVRLEFSDFSVANLTASRMSMKNMRKFRIFQKEAYMSMDLEKKSAEIVKLSNEFVEGSVKIPSDKIEKYVNVQSSGALEGNAIVSELNTFHNAIVNKADTGSSFFNAIKTTELADEIETIALQSANIV